MKSVAMYLKKTNYKKKPQKLKIYCENDNGENERFRQKISQGATPMKPK